MFQFPLSDVVLFSAYAEVFPLCHPVSSFFSPFLCLRRGVSSLLGESVLLECFSLPTQRCFLFTRKVNERRRLFSAYAEVFLMRRKAQRLNGSFLCLRRGVFISKMITISSNALFSAYAEMFPLEGTTKHLYFACLCLRRGVSVIVIEIISSCYFSLPTQRCFPDIKQLFLQPILFSAYAEMFPSTQSEQSDVWAFLCLHRGVS